MEHATIIGIDLAKRSFQLHGARADGSVAFRKKLNRDRVLGMARGEGRRSWLPSADTETYTLVGLRRSLASVLHPKLLRSSGCL